MAVTKDKFIEGISLAIEAYRSLPNPTFNNAKNVIAFVETGLMLLGENGGMERLMEELGGEPLPANLQPKSDDTGDEADVIELDAFRKGGGLVN